jgi:hypothetical protein
MTQQYQSTFNNTLTNDVAFINYAINRVLLDVCTTFPAKITAIDGLRATVNPIINTVGVNQQSPLPLTIANVPIVQLAGGNAGVIIEYQVGDVVTCYAIQRDISSIKNNWTQANPASQRKFSYSDIVIWGLVSNAAPSTYVKITNAGIEIVSNGGNPINLTTTGTATISAGTVKLGNGTQQPVILENVSLTANITGVEAGGGVSGATVTFTSGGSSQVSGGI